ncbi:MAG: 4-(cytidine 5'-diphospho)-2-C-methyl-D-erythritol kinase [Desulfobacterales bacterium]|nr:4-(cytidine 5'-diphospho)-2-C-methyl-D-erythritol kinase [Desulfobacterales bacterium]
MIQTLASPAKINLFLHVTGKRPDGYHELCSAMVKLDLADEMVFDFSRSGIDVTCDHPLVPGDETNLVWRAAELFFREWEGAGYGSLPIPGMGVEIHKKIPVGGGLGGGSSNAATTLAALNGICGDRFSRDALMAMGLELGADVPFFLFGGPALARGVGEVLEPLAPVPEMAVLLVDPGIFASTVRVFKNFKLTTREFLTINPGSNVLPNRQTPETGVVLENDLEISAFELYPGIRAAKEEMASLLNEDVHMSGSGAALFILYPDQDRAKDDYQQLIQHWTEKPFQVILSSLSNT